MFRALEGIKCNESYDSDIQKCTPHQLSNLTRKTMLTIIKILIRYKLVLIQI